MTLALDYALLFEYFNLVNNIWIVSAGALIFHMNIEFPCDKIFLLVLNFLTLTFYHFLLLNIDIGHNF